jgi:hypothetical protein
MAVPALVGLAALGGLVTKVVEKLVDFTFTRLAKRLAVLTVIVAGLFTAVYTFLSLVEGLVSPLLSEIPPELATMGYFFPSNTQACLSAIVATELAVLSYTLTIKALNAKFKVVQ